LAAVSPAARRATARRSRYFALHDIDVGTGPSWTDIRALRAWLATAELPEPPLGLMPGLEAHDVERLRAQLLAETALGDSAGAVLNLRYLAARYGPPEIAALARPDSLLRPPRRRQD
jgi:hypothetical protein